MEVELLAESIFNVHLMSGLRAFKSEFVTILCSHKTFMRPYWILNVPSVNLFYHPVVWCRGELLMSCIIRKIGINWKSQLSVQSQWTHAVMSLWCYCECTVSHYDITSSYIISCTINFVLVIVNFQNGSCQSTRKVNMLTIGFSN